MKQTPPASDQRSLLAPVRQVSTRLERAVKQSIADETEVVWFEKQSSRIAFRIPDANEFAAHEQSVQVRVHDGGRMGFFRTGASDRGEVCNATRSALANSRSAATTSPPLMSGPDGEEPTSPQLFDRDLATLTPKEARRILVHTLDPDEAALFEWHAGQVVLRNSRGLEQRKRVTSAFLQIRSGEGPGAGFATGAARSLAELRDLEVEERARKRRTDAPVAKFDPEPCPVILSPEATIELVELLNHRAFSSHAYREGNSFVREHLGTQVFDANLHLRDDGSDPSGLPFPFDLEGRTKTPIALIAHGVAKTPTVDTAAALEFQIEPTAHSVGGGEAFGLNLFMEPGELSEDELLQAGSDGLWISRLENIECFDANRMLLRAVARGVRTVRDGRVANPLPDLVWTDSLLRVFSRFEAIGRSTSLKISRDGILGGTAAPSVVLPAVSGLEIRR